MVSPELPIDFDAQNAFGAVLRNSATCVLYDPDARPAQLRRMELLIGAGCDGASCTMINRAISARFEQ